jgi:hypothetical protein
MSTGNRLRSGSTWSRFASEPGSGERVMTDTPTRPYGYISGVLDVTTGLLYVNHETALENGCYPVNLVMVSAAMQSIKKIVSALLEANTHVGISQS